MKDKKMRLRSKKIVPEDRKNGCTDEEENNTVLKTLTEERQEQADKNNLQVLQNLERQNQSGFKKK